LDDFSHWFRDQVARCFLEAGSDYAELFGEKPENPRGGRPRREYVLTLHASRKVWMAAGTVRGNAVREYFAEQERRFLAGEAPIPGTAPVLPYSIAPSRLWDVPLSMADFLWLAGLSRQRARDLAAVNEVRLAEDLVRHRRAGEVGRHPITRQVLFLRGALDEWWAAFAAEVIAAAPPAGSR
jgi:phage anti-repressor protein